MRLFIIRVSVVRSNDDSTCFAVFTGTYEYFGKRVYVYVECRMELSDLQWRIRQLFVSLIRVGSIDV